MDLTITPPAGNATESDDGRRARRDRNRSAVVESMLDLMNEGNLSPTSDEIAARSGVSARSLFRYFDDIDDLARAAIDLQQRRVLPLAVIDVATDAPFVQRVTALVDQRSRVFEAIGPVGHVSRMRSLFQPVLHAELTRVRELLRRQLARVFESELSAMQANRSAQVLAVADVVTSFESYRLLRDDQGLSIDDAKAAMSLAIASLLSPAS